MSEMSGRIETLPDPAALAHHVAEWMTAAALAAKGEFRVSLSGGSTPKALFTLLASDSFWVFALLAMIFMRIAACRL
jgi:6-phosphogluconolactonase